jgi:outer membrane receptor protein involved in Fe transport
LRIAALVVAFAGVSYAQTVGASLQGVVNDPSGAAVAKASVQILEVETGVARSLVTDDAGRWREPLLAPGEYQVRAQAPGFKTLVRNGVLLEMGQDTTLNLQLEVGALETVINVDGGAASVRLASGENGGLVGERQMRDLPLNGRSFQQLALLEPGVNAVTAGGNDPVGGRTPKISISGARPEQSSFLLDGSDINNVYNKTPGSVGGVLLGVEAVLEFQVLTNSYSAEFGRATGGVINAVTRSGTNAPHGSAFEFLRNSAMDAKDFFAAPGATIPPLKRNQFGATAGGKIRKDKTFYFAAFESLIERLGVSGVTNVPDANARKGLLPTSASDPTLRQIPLNPAIPAYLNLLFPLPNGRALGGGAAQYLFTAPQPDNEYFTQGRIDHHFSEFDTLFGRYTFDNGAIDRPPVNKPPITNTKERSRNQYTTLEEQHAFSPVALNTLRLGYNRSTSESNNERTIDIPPALSWIPGQPFGYLTISGLVTEAAGDYRLPRNDHLNTWEANDTFFLTRGRHGLRIGMTAQRMQFNQNTTSQVGGLVTFTGLENFLRGIPTSIDFAVPGKTDPIRGYRQSLFGFYAQDDIRLRRNLTVNVGLRYEFTTVPTEVNGKISNLRNVTDTKLTVGGEWYRNPSLKNFAPRLGIAWDPIGDGRTSVRGGFGIFYDEILPKYYFFSGSLNPPFTTRTSIQNPSFPNLVAGFDPNGLFPYQLQTMNYNVQSSYAMQFNLGVERSVARDLTVGASYAGSRGLHLFRIADANLAPESIVNGIKVYQPALGRRNPNFASITQRITDAQSYYNALQLSVVKRFAHGMRAQASYSFSRSIDDSSGVNSQDYSDGSVYSFDYYDRKADRGLSSFWAQQVFTGNWSWELPLARSATGLKAALLKGWQWNSIATVQTGHPFEVRLGFNRSGNLNTVNYAMHERPDVNPAFTGPVILGGPDRYWNIAAFTLQPANQRGNLGRNTLIGPGLVGYDTSLAKSFPIGGERRVELRGEWFNLPNHPNFAVPSGRTAFSSVDASGKGVIAPDWGVISSTVASARQVQVGVKLLW